MTELRIEAVDHIGIRVADAARSEAFYAKLGFRRVFAGGDAASPVVILRTEQGVEINLIVNADRAHDGTNILMDGGMPKYAGYTHVALRIKTMDETLKALEAAGIVRSEGPVRLGGGLSVFIRDPDKNVVELRDSSA